MSERNTRGIQLVGINPADEEISFYKDLEIEGEPLEDSADKGVVIGADLATELETKLGRKIVLVSQTIDGTSAEIGLKVKGIFTSETASLEKIYAFTGIDYVKEVLDTPNVTEVSLRLNVNESMGVNQAKLAELYPDLEVLNWSQMDPLAFQMYEYSSFAVYMLLVVILSTLVFGLVNTLVTAVLERIREFGLLRAVGMRSSAVVVQVVIESVLMMVVALILGLGLGYLIYLSMANGIDLGDYSEAMELMGMNSVLVPEIHVDDVLTIVCFSLILSFVASLIPARRAVKMKLLDALR